MDPYQIVEDIKNLKIQGAEGVARSSVLAMRVYLEEHKGASKELFLRGFNHLKGALLTSRPTEPCMYNALLYVSSGLNGKNCEDIKQNLSLRITSALIHFDESNKKIPRIGAGKISDGMIVFTHCHSSTVIQILLEAKRLGKDFEVHNTETRPLFQGRKTAKELSEKGIKVTHFVDSAARLALKKADLMLIGADAITAEGKVVNKIGSELFAEVACREDIPVYVCSNSWKFDPKTVFGYEEIIETRNKREVWPNPPKNVVIDNHAFEVIRHELISGIISDLGVCGPEVFVQEIRRNHPWMLVNNN